MAKLGGIYVSVRAKTTKLAMDFRKAKGMAKKTAVLMSHELGKIGFGSFAIPAAAFSAATIMITKEVISLGREFESTMKTVQAWSGATGKELEGLTNIARKMGATTEHTATQSADALKFLAAAGFSAKKSIAALPGTLNLATAGQVNLADATDITTDVLTAFGMEVEDLNKVNDAFITTTSNSNTNVLMLGQSMKMVAPTAKLFGLSVEQTAAYLGTLANAGVKAEMAGSGLNMVLLKSARAAKALGLEAGTPLIEVLKKMKEEQWGAVKVGEAFGARQVKTAGILMDNIETYEKLNKKIIENVGATGKLAAIIRDSLDVDIRTLQSTIEEQLLRTFDRYNDDIRDVVQATTDWIRDNEQAIDGIADLTKNMMDLFLVMGKIIGVGVEFLGIWVKTWQAMGIASTGMISWKTAMLNGVDAVKKMDTELGVAQLQAERLREKLQDLGANVKFGRGFLGKKRREEIKQTEAALLAVQARIVALKITMKEASEAKVDIIPGVTKTIDIQTKSRLSTDKPEDLEKILKASIAASDARLKIQEQFNLKYEELGLNRFDLERLQLEREVAAYRKAGADKNKIDEFHSKKSIDIARREQTGKLDIYQNIAGGIADTFKAIAQAGGEQSKKAFKIYKATAMVEAGIMGAKTILQSLSNYPPPYSYILAGIAGAAAAIQIGTIANSQPPSYEIGTPYVPQTGLAMLHQGERVLTKRENQNFNSGGGGGQQPVQIILNNPVFQDLETQRQVMSQIASVVAAEVAPGAVVENYNNDGMIRRIVRGGR